MTQIRSFLAEFVIVYDNYDNIYSEVLLTLFAQAEAVMYGIEYISLVKYLRISGMLHAYSYLL